MGSWVGRNAQVVRPEATRPDTAGAESRSILFGSPGKVPADLIAGTPPEIVAGSSRIGFMAAAVR